VVESRRNLIEFTRIRTLLAVLIPIVVVATISGCGDLRAGESAAGTTTTRIPWTETEPVVAPTCEEGETFHRVVPGTLAQLGQWSDGVVVGRVVSQRVVTITPHGLQHVESALVIERSLAGRFAVGETVRMWSTGSGEPGQCDPRDVKPTVDARYMVFLVQAGPLGDEPAPDAYWPFGGAATGRFRVDANDLIRSDTGPGGPVHDEIVLETVDEIARVLRR
jgi:hypothetical protein